MKTFEDEDGNDLYDACFPSKIGNEDHEYFLCAHEDHGTPEPDFDRKKRSADENAQLSRTKRGSTYWVDDVLSYTAIYCPRFLPNSCASPNVSFIYSSR